MVESAVEFLGTAEKVKTQQMKNQKNIYIYFFEREREIACKQLNQCGN
jgi:hypothetical protein